MTSQAGAGSDIADPELAALGQPRIEWAGRSMPVLGLIRGELAAAQPFAGLAVAACLHLTPETACLVNLIRAGGGRVQLAASNPLSTQDDIAAALAALPGVSVSARAGVDRSGYYQHLHRALDGGPDLVLDDGGDLVNTLHEERPELLAGVRGGCEATASGAARLRRMAAAGTLAFPMFAADQSVVRRMYDNRYGTGQSVLDGIMRATHTLLAGQTLAVAGFGPAGSGIAERARGLGARVVVTETDPVRALDASLQGFTVLPMQEAAASADVLITATGSRDVIAAGHLALLRDGAILANAGHFDVEIDVRALAAAAIKITPQVRPHADEYLLADGRRLILLAEGRVVNLVAAEGNPAAVMDLSFAVQVLALARLAGRDPGGEGALAPVPADIDAAVARLALAARGIAVDELTAAQQEYLDSWREGS